MARSPVAIVICCFTISLKLIYGEQPCALILPYYGIWRTCNGDTMFLSMKSVLCFKTEKLLKFIFGIFLFLLLNLFPFNL